MGCGASLPAGDPPPSRATIKEDAHHASVSGNISGMNEEEAQAVVKKARALVKTLLNATTATAGAAAAAKELGVLVSKGHAAAVIEAGALQPLVALLRRRGRAGAWGGAGAGAGAPGSDDEGSPEDEEAVAQAAAAMSWITFKGAFAGARLGGTPTPFWSIGPFIGALNWSTIHPFIRPLTAPHTQSSRLHSIPVQKASHHQRRTFVSDRPYTPRVIPQLKQAPLHTSRANKRMTRGRLWRRGVRR